MHRAALEALRADAHVAAEEVAARHQAHINELEQAGSLARAEAHAAATRQLEATRTHLSASVEAATAEASQARERADAAERRCEAKSIVAQQVTG